jgi:translation elongation factor EF-1alpha
MLLLWVAACVCGLPRHSRPVCTCPRLLPAPTSLPSNQSISIHLFTPTKHVPSIVQVTLHAHTARESGHISGLVSLLNAKTGEVLRSKPRCLLKGQTAVVEVTPARPLCLEDFADMRALGRVALRDGGRTVAVGIVTGVTPVE